MMRRSSGNPRLAIGLLAAFISGCGESSPAPGASEATGPATTELAPSTDAPSGPGASTDALTDAGTGTDAPTTTTTTTTTTDALTGTTTGADTSTSTSTGTDTGPDPGTTRAEGDSDTGEEDVQPSAGCGLRDAPTGLLKGQETLVDGVARAYDVFVPKPYDAARPHAVIFSYHGVGGTANTDQFRLDKNSVANGGFSINVAPQGWPSAEWPENHFVPFNLDASLKVFDQVLDDLAARYCVDLKRVFVIGHSNGGQMAFHLGCLRGQRIRAIFPSGGRCFSYGPGVCDPYNGPQAQCSGAVAVMSVMGQNDVTRHADEEATLAGFRGRQGCGASTEPVAPAPCQQFQGCAPGQEVATCRIPGIAHVLWKDGHDPLYQAMMSF